MGINIIDVSIFSANLSLNLKFELALFTSNAVVGSSAINTLGSQAKIFAITILCLCHQKTDVEKL